MLNRIKTFKTSSEPNENTELELIADEHQKKNDVTRKYNKIKKAPLLEVRKMPADVCTKALGEIGWWQIRSILLVSLVKIPSAWQMASILFTAPSPGEFWCARPTELQHLDIERWKDFIHPPLNTSSGIRDSCNIYDVGTEMLSMWSNELHQMPENVTLAPCRRFEFSNDATTVVTQWNLVCQREVLVSVSQFFYLLGILVGGVVCAQLLKRFSPRRIFFMGIITQVLAGAAVAEAPQFELQVSLRFLTAVACANMFTSGYVICTDITGGKWRTITGACYEHMWSVGVVTLAALGYLLNNWQELQLAISLPSILIFFAYPWIPDSPRWLLANGHETEAKYILEQGATFNGRLIPTIEVPTSSTSRWNCMALHVAWAASVVTYYGALLNVKNLGDRLYLNTAVAGLAEVAGVLLGLTLMLWSRCKWTALGLILLAGGGACVASWALPPDGLSEKHEWEMLGLGMIGRIAIASSLTLLQVTSNELLPPEHRQIGIFSSVTFARVFLLSAPFIGSLAMYGDCVSLSAFGGITITGGLATLFLGRQGSKIHNTDKHLQSNGNVQSIWSTTKLDRSSFKISSTKPSEAQLSQDTQSVQHII